MYSSARPREITVFSYHVACSRTGTLEMLILIACNKNKHNGEHWNSRPVNSSAAIYLHTPALVAAYPSHLHMDQRSPEAWVVLCVYPSWIVLPTLPRIPDHGGESWWRIMVSRSMLRHVLIRDILSGTQRAILDLMPSHVRIRARSIVMASREVAISR